MKVKGDFMSETIWLTSSECATQLRISQATLWRWVKEGKVPALRLGGRKLIFARKEIENLGIGKSA
jgi:excisionase family DNA binding protein